MIMNEGETAKLPIVLYKLDGTKEIIGEAVITLKNGEVTATGEITSEDTPYFNKDIVCFSINKEK